MYAFPDSLVLAQEGAVSLQFNLKVLLHVDLSPLLPQHVNNCLLQLCDDFSLSSWLDNTSTRSAVSNPPLLLLCIRVDDRPP